MTRISVKELERRGYKYGTAAECWEALRIIADAIKRGQPVSEDVALWFSNAVTSNTDNDIDGLVRDMGFVEQGRPRVVNRFDVMALMKDLTENKGHSKAAAARIAARELHCSKSTALHWHSKSKTIRSTHNH